MTFIAATGDGGVDTIYADENSWLTQKMMGTLYNVETHTINYHLKNIFSDSELDEHSVIRNFRITANDGKNYNNKHYNLSAIISVGYKINSERAVQFRKWATQIVQEFTIKGFAMDDERLKNDGTILGKKYFEELKPFPQPLPQLSKLARLASFDNLPHHLQAYFTAIYWDFPEFGKLSVFRSAR